MGTVSGRIRVVRRELMFDAARRWASRTAERDSGLAKVAAMGPGAADSPAQVARFMSREAKKSAFGLPRFTERILGTNDLVSVAPSAQALAIATPVARITTAPGTGYAPEGFASGLLLPGGLLLTNFHVFPGRPYAAGCAANFGHARDERGVSEGTYFELDPGHFFVGDEALDFAIVAVGAKSTSGTSLSDIPSTKLIEVTGKVLTGMPVNIIQHPGGGSRQFAVSNNRLVDILPEGYLHYEADTDRGSSGSPVYNRDWEFLALHHSGVPEIVDGKVRTTIGGIWNEGDPEEAIHWIANEGTRVSYVVEFLKRAQLDSEQERAILKALLGTTHDPLDAAAVGVETSLPLALRSTSMPGNSFNFTGPVTIHVYAPGSAATAGDEAPAGRATKAIGEISAFAGVAVEKTLVFDPDYASRKGYQTGFLGRDVPLPTVVAGRQSELYTVGDYKKYFDEYRDIPEVNVTGLTDTDAFELKYRHFSLVHNKKFRMCMFTASNCDYRDIQRQDPRSRRQFGGEDWQYDPRVPWDLQLGNDDVYGPARRVDRGHIVRREDNCWGAIGTDTEYSNSDTYHWPNCTPQHEAFNQENPNDNSKRGIYTGTGTKGIWGQFEGALQGQIIEGGGQAIIFAGPVLKDFFEAIDWGIGRVPIPKRFWKIVIVPKSPVKKPDLLVYGFLFSQEKVVKQFGLTYEKLVVPEFMKSRETLANITAMTGVEFPPVVLAGERP